MTCRHEGTTTYNQIYDAENRLVFVQKVGNVVCPPAYTVVSPDYGSWTFNYDGDGNRVAQKYQGANAFWKRFTMGGDYEVRHTNSTLTEVVKYYSGAGGERIAMRSCGETCGAPTYLLHDHLGSITATTDVSGSLLNQQRYKPPPPAL
jgi:YD repeat-containing protein